MLIPRLPIWGYLLVILALTHISNIAVTIFLHRCQAHRSLFLHPIASHFFRFWLWLTTGTGTKGWVAVHRKHHHAVDTDVDPHSPQVKGIMKVLFGGYFLYRSEAQNAETLAAYGKGTPDDWIERHLYTKYPQIGTSSLFFLNLLIFGIPGPLVWLGQMLWMPFVAGGVINGIGHYWGYRNHETQDASTNIVPWGIIVAGEELHNNHHKSPWCAKLSHRPWEFDIGWMYIRILEVCRLAYRVRYPHAQPREESPMV